MVQDDSTIHTNAPLSPSVGVVPTRVLLAAFSCDGARLRRRAVGCASSQLHGHTECAWHRATLPATPPGDQFISSQMDGERGTHVAGTTTTAAAHTPRTLRSTKRALMGEAPAPEHNRYVRATSSSRKKKPIVAQAEAAEEAEGEMDLADYHRLRPTKKSLAGSTSLPRRIFRATAAHRASTLAVNGVAEDLMAIDFDSSDSHSQSPGPAVGVQQQQAQPAVPNSLRVPPAGANRPSTCVDEGLPTSPTHRSHPADGAATKRMDTTAIGDCRQPGAAAAAGQAGAAGGGGGSSSSSPLVVRPSLRRPSEPQSAVQAQSAPTSLRIIVPSDESTWQCVVDPNHVFSPTSNGDYSLITPTRASDRDGPGAATKKMRFDTRPGDRGPDPAAGGELPSPSTVARTELTRQVMRRFGPNNPFDEPLCQAFTHLKRFGIDSFDELDYTHVQHQAMHLTNHYPGLITSLIDADEGLAELRRRYTALTSAVVDFQHVMRQMAEDAIELSCWIVSHEVETRWPSNHSSVEQDRPVPTQLSARVTSIVGTSVVGRSGSKSV